MSTGKAVVKSTAGCHPEEARSKEELHRCSILGDVEAALALLDSSVDLINTALDPDGNTSLHLAAIGGHLRLTQALLQRRADVDAQEGKQRTPLHVACNEERADVVRELISGGANVDAVDALKQTALHKAARSNNVDVLAILVEHGVPDLVAADSNGMHALHIAAELGLNGALDYLLSHGASVTATNKNGWSALHLAAHGCEMRATPLKPGKFVTAVRRLLELKAPVDATDEDNKTALHRATATGNRATTTALLEGGADVNFEDICRWTPLHYAVQEGHLEVAKILLEAKSEVQRENPSCLTPLAVATMESQVKMAELLMQWGADPQLRAKGLASPIMIARGDPKKFNEILALFDLGFISHAS